MYYHDLRFIIMLWNLGLIDAFSTVTLITNVGVQWSGIDPSYSINARFLNISKFNETVNGSNTPSGNKTIIILPPEPKNN